jgi:hypothetical protein
MRFNVLEKYLSQDGNLHATVVAIHDGARSATFKLRSGEQQLVNYAHVLRGYWQKQRA